MTYFTQPPTHCPSVKHQFVLYVAKNLFLDLPLSPPAHSPLCSFVLFLKFFIWVKSYGICLSLSDLLLWALCSLSPSMSLQMARFYSFWWQSNIPYIYHIFFIPSSGDGHLSCFHNLVTVDNAAINIGVHANTCHFLKWPTYTVFCWCCGFKWENYQNSFPHIFMFQCCPL